MENMQEQQKQYDYKVENTMYYVTPIFREATDAEHIEKKIERLILKDHEVKSALA